MSGEHQLRFLALGDSYTIGQNVEIAERWPVQLVQRLRGEGVNIGEAEIIALTGWTTRQLTEALVTSNTQGQFDIVSLMIGVNNQYQGFGIGQYRLEFIELLHRSVAYTVNKPSHVIVVSIPDWSVTPFAEGKDRARVAKEIDDFNAVNRDEAAKVGASSVNVTTVSRRAADEPHLLFDDCLHPSVAMYSRLVDLIIPACHEAVGP